MTTAACRRHGTFTVGSLPGSSSHHKIIASSHTCIHQKSYHGNKPIYRHPQNSTLQQCRPLSLFLSR